MRAGIHRHCGQRSQQQQRCPAQAALARCRLQILGPLTVSIAVKVEPLVVPERFCLGAHLLLKQMPKPYSVLLM